MIYSKLNLNPKLKQNNEHYEKIGINPYNTIIYEVNDKIPFTPIKFIKKKGAKHDKRLFMSEPMALDTETSHNDDETIGWIYQWCLRVGRVYIGGRTPTELMKALEKIKNFYELNSEKLAICYIHNMSYDYCYIQHFLHDSFGMCELLATRPRKIIFAKYDFIIFKDSLILSTKSLEKWGKDTNARVLKASGTIDYDVKRYQDSKLNADDWYYMLNDVECLHNCILQELKGNHDSLPTIPLTSTGFVRRDTRKNFQAEKYARLNFFRRRLNARMYDCVDTAYMGAYTHGNRFLKDTIISQPVGHGDFRSFYPSTIMCDGFPSTPFQRCLIYEIDDIMNHLNTWCCLCVIEIGDVEIKENITAPILSKDRFEKGMSTKEKIIHDNGRILKTKGYSIMCVTELDLYWIKRQYHADIKLLETWKSNKRKAPKYLRNTTNEYFKKKTVFKQMLKNKDLTPTDRLELEQDLMRSKGRLNAIYGMCATRIVRSKWNYNFNTNSWIEEKQEKQDSLNKYYQGKSNFSEYQIGCWVTANCRHRLLSLIEGMGYENFIYCDTDSIFYLKNDKTINFFKKVNEENYNERIKNDEFIEDINGNIVEYMAFEDENDDIQQYKFLHSKCYASMNSKNELKCTIAGVTAFWREDLAKPVEERRTREDEMQNLDNLKTGFTFSHCGGTRAIYNDCECCEEYIDGHLIEHESSCIISNTEKTMHETEYEFFDFEFKNLGVI